MRVYCNFEGLTFLNDHAFIKYSNEIIAVKGKYMFFYF